jgi:hypothetical protein
MTFSKHEIAWAGASWDRGRVIEYKVDGSSPDEETFIANFGAHGQDKWRVLRVKGGITGEWAGSFASAGEAMATLRSLRAQPFQDRSCPKCLSLVPSTIVYSVPAAPTFEPTYTYHGCVRCGELVSRIISGGERPVGEAVNSKAERRIVLDAARARSPWICDLF